jgi:hypothetical protein
MLQICHRMLSVARKPLFFEETDLAELGVPNRVAELDGPDRSPRTRSAALESPDVVLGPAPRRTRRFVSRLSGL